MDDLHIEVVKIQVLFTIQNIRNGDSVGRRIKIQLAQHELESGLAPPFTTLRGRPKYLTETWMLYLLQGLKEY